MKKPRRTLFSDDTILAAMRVMLKRGFMPTTRGLGKTIGSKSTSTASEAMRRLAAKGLAVRLKLNQGQAVYLPADLCFDKSHGGK